MTKSNAGFKKTPQEPYQKVLFPRKGEIWLLKNPEWIKEFSKDYRPVLIISNNERNEYDNSVAVLPLTTDDLENILPVEVYIKNTPRNWAGRIQQGSMRFSFYLR